MSHVSPGHVCHVVPVRPSLGTRGLGVHLHARERRVGQTAERDMADLRAERPSSSDYTEFTECPASHRLFESRPNGPRVIYTYSRDGLNANRPRLDLLDMFHVYRAAAAASAKHENFIIS